MDSYERVKLGDYKIYIVTCSEGDYFIVLAKTKDDAVEKLQEYWRPLNGMGKIWERVSEGFPLSSLLEGRHLTWIEHIGKGGHPDDSPNTSEEMGKNFVENEFKRGDRVREEIKTMFPKATK